MTALLSLLLASTIATASPELAAAPDPAATVDELVAQSDTSVPDTSAPASIAPTNSAELSVLTYNVHGLPWPFATKRKQQLRQIGEELGRMRREGRQPGIVLVQEGFSGEMRDLIRLSGYRYWVEGPTRGQRLAPGETVIKRLKARYRQRGEGWGKLTGSGLYILSDYPVQSVSSQPYNSCAGWDCLANKGAMLVHVAVDGVPGGIDVANTHMNSRGAAKVPVARTLRAYDRQVGQLHALLGSRTDTDRPLLVGGDFNVRHAPDRYSKVVEPKAFDVVSQYCLSRPDSCGSGHAPDASPWLDTQDLQGFAGTGPVTIQPVGSQRVFDNRDAPRLSDHDGYLVRYRLSWAG